MEMEQDMSDNATINEKIEITHNIPGRLIINKEGITNTIQHSLDTSRDMFNFYVKALVDSYDIDGTSHRKYVTEVAIHFREHFAEMEQYLKEHSS